VRGPTYQPEQIMTSHHKQYKHFKTERASTDLL